MNKILIPLLIFTLFSSCTETITSEGKETTKEIAVENNFRRFLKKFPKISLPLNMRIHTGISLENLQKVNNDEAKEFLKGESNYYCYGMLEDTLHYYALILLYPADKVIPEIFTFSKEGEFISSQQLIIKGCAYDCGYRKCTSDCIIDEKKNISLIDTNDFYECDENGEEVLSNREYTTEVRIFNLNRLGKFIPSSPLRMDLSAK
jgi:hypothetical protein